MKIIIQYLIPLLRYKKELNVILLGFVLFILTINLTATLTTLMVTFNTDAHAEVTL